MKKKKQASNTVRSDQVLDGLSQLLVWGIITYLFIYSFFGVCRLLNGTRALIESEHSLAGNACVFQRYELYRGVSFRVSAPIPSRQHFPPSTWLMPKKRTFRSGCN